CGRRFVHSQTEQRGLLRCGSGQHAVERCYEQQQEQQRHATGSGVELFAAQRKCHCATAARFSELAPASFASSITRTSSSVGTCRSACSTTGRSCVSSKACSVARTPSTPMLLPSCTTSPPAVIAIR